MKQQLIDFYLDYVNNFLTTERMAEHYGLTADHTSRLIDIGRIYFLNEKNYLTTIEEIKQAVDEGKTVYMENEGYQVIKDNTGQYMIKCTLNGYGIGLHGAEGTEFERKLNGTNFYTKN